jgi:hypothetical protein
MKLFILILSVVSVLALPGAKQPIHLKKSIGKFSTNFKLFYSFYSCRWTNNRGRHCKKRTISLRSGHLYNHRWWKFFLWWDSRYRPMDFDSRTMCWWVYFIQTFWYASNIQWIVAFAYLPSIWVRIVCREVTLMLLRSLQILTSYIQTIILRPWIMISVLYGFANLYHFPVKLQTPDLQSC